jgi:WD40 repeat protein
MVAIADSSGSVLLWDVLTNSVLTRFLSRSGINAVRFSRCGHYLFAGGDDGSVTVWKAGSAVPVNVFRDHQSPVTALACSTDRSYCFSADKSGRIIVRNLLSGKTERDIQGHIGDVTGLELSADGRFLFSSAKETLVKVWQTAEPFNQYLIEGHPAAVSAMVLEISGRRLVTGCADGVVRAWELLWNYRFPNWQPVTAEAESVLRSLLSLYSADGTEKPKIDESGTSRIVLEMGYCGFGTIPAAEIRKKIGDLVATWN